MVLPKGLIFIAFVASIGWSAASLAQHMNAVDSPCPNIAQTAALTSCLAAARGATDLRLNAAYATATSRLHGDTRQQLVRAERLWLQYHDAFCGAAHRSFGGGTGGPPAELACLERLSRDQANALETAFPDH